MGDFYPVSPLVNIPNTSYAAQAGVMNEKWAARVLRGKKILIEKNIIELNLENFVGVIYGHARSPGLSRHAVAQCAGRLMQFARRYQQTGVCPNFEIPDLVREDGTTTVEESTPSEEVAAVTTQETTEATLVIRPLGRVPAVDLVDVNTAWNLSLEAQAALIQEMAAYGSSLPQGHLKTMFEKVAETVVRKWTAYEDPNTPITRFAHLILSCTGEGQLPKTGSGTVSIETGSCSLLNEATWFDEAGTSAPPAYPCAFHEAVAEFVMKATGLKIRINTSSTGCIVTIALE